MILGISLVVNELNKGQRMVFRYPESVPQSVVSGANKGLIKLYEQYFGFRYAKVVCLRHDPSHLILIKLVFA